MEQLYDINIHNNADRKIYRAINKQVYHKQRLLTKDSSLAERRYVYPISNKNEIVETILIGSHQIHIA